MNTQAFESSDALPRNIDWKSHEIHMVRLLLASDHPNMCDELKRVFARTADIVVNGEAASGKETLQQLRKNPFDLLLLDMDMLDGGIDLIKSVKAYNPVLPIVILITREQVQMVIPALKAGASGLIVKGSDSDILLSAIHTVGIDEIMYVDPILTEQAARSPRISQPHTLLSIIEFTIFLLLGSGKSVNQIANGLSMSKKIASSYKMDIMKKMNFQNTEDIMSYAVQHRLAD